MFKLALEDKVKRAVDEVSALMPQQKEWRQENMLSIFRFLKAYL
jgi:hypothetical protein